jgi:hypothetical protein
LIVQKLELADGREGLGSGLGEQGMRKECGRIQWLGRRKGVSGYQTRRVGVVVLQEQEDCAALDSDSIHWAKYEAKAQPFVAGVQLDSGSIHLGRCVVRLRGIVAVLGKPLRMRMAVDVVGLVSLGYRCRAGVGPWNRVYLGKTCAY